MHTSQRISKFYEDLEALGLRFPGKELSEKLGVSKGLVSDIINKRKVPSDEFIKDFYNEFTKGSRQVDNNATILSSGNVNITLQDYLNLQQQMIDKLSQTNDKLLDIVSSTLHQIHNDQQYTLAYLKAEVEYQAEKEAPNDLQKQKEIVYKMGKLVDGKLQVGASKDTPPETGISHSSNIR